MRPGAMLGPYRILEKLGEGGMGEVYRARDTRLDRDVAVKVLPAHLADDPAALARFEREARAVAALSHPNILGVFDAGREGSTAYLVTELLEGDTLRERLAGGALPAREAARYGAEIASGLAAAHEKGIVHRDLKPENVFVTSDGHVKILDFGLAKQEQAAKPLGSPDAPTRTASTSPGVVLGTVAYMAPEQVRGQVLDHRADLFAFGALLYELLTGRRAFERETAAETMTAILKEEPPELTSIDPTIPVGLARLVQHCLEKRPEERFQSARDLAFDLQAVAATSTAAARPVRAPAGRRARQLLAVGIATVATISAAYLAGRFVERRTPAPPLAFRQLTFRPQGILRAAFAPDGETVVFSSVFSGDVPDLFVRRREYPEQTPLALPRTHLLAISPQGELAVLTNPKCLAWRQCRGTLARVPLGGTGPRAILDGVADADWSPDGTTLAVVRSAEGRDRLEYPIGTTLYQSSGGLSHVRVSPRGSLLALFEHPSHYDDRGFVILVDQRGKRSVLTGEYAALEGLAWSPAGDEVFFTGSGSGGGVGDFQAYGVDLHGRTRASVRSAGGISLHDISRAGRWLVTRDDRAIGIMARAPSEKDERDLSFLDGSWGPVLSRDGRTMLFTEVSEEVRTNYAVYLRPTDGSAVVRLGEGTAMGISPDGRWALAVTQTPQAAVIYPMASGEGRTLARGSLVGYRAARWFPDGRRILVCGDEQGKAARCYVQDLDGGLPRAATPDGEDGLVSPDGQRVVVWRPGDVPAIYRIDNGARERLPSVSTDDRPIAWGADGQTVLFTTPGHVPGRIDRVDLRAGRRELVREFAPPDRTGMLQAVASSVAADPDVYAYEYYRMRSALFLVDGVR